MISAATPCRVLCRSGTGDPSGRSDFSERWDLYATIIHPASMTIRLRDLPPDVRKRVTGAVEAPKRACAARTRTAAPVAPVQASACVTEDGALHLVLLLPPKALTPNGRAHHMAKARATAKRREFVCRLIWSTVLGLQARASGPPWQAAEIQVTFFYPNRRRDEDNAKSLTNCKADFDGIADALGINDSRFTHLPPVLEIDCERPRVEVLVRERKP